MSFQGPHWSSMNDEKTLIPQGIPQLALKHHYIQVQRHSCPSILQQHKNKLKLKAIQYIQRPEIWDRRKQSGGVKVLWRDHNPPPFIYGHKYIKPICSNYQWL